MLSFSCPGCNKKMQAKEELVGKQVKCPQCGKSLVVSTSPTVEPNQPKPAAKKLSIAPPKPSLEATEGANVAEDKQYATLSPGGDSNEERFDFLTPAKAAGELGWLGGYRVVKVLGSGGMGMVFQAEDPQLERLIALKVMKPDMKGGEAARQRFLREAKSTAALKHDNIVTIYQVGEAKGAAFLAMEFLEGESLDDCLKREKKLSTGEVLRIGREIAEGLVAAHKRGLIHRDIKPGNIWLEGERRRVKILDFGLARTATDETHLTQSGAILGTPAYMAPEQARAELVDHRCDLFSLGSVLYRMSSGEMPFKGKDTVSMLLAVTMDNPKPPRECDAEIPEPLSALTMKLLAKNREDRPSSAQAVVDTIQEIERTSPFAARKSGVAEAAQAIDKNQEPTVSLAPKDLETKERPPSRSWKALLLGVPVLLLLLVLCLSGSWLGWALLVSGSSGSGSSSTTGSGSDNVNAEQSPRELEVALGDGVKMKLVLIPAAGKTFWMGSPVREVDRKPDEEQHEVEFSEDFYMGVYEVTQAQYKAVTKKNPSHFSKDGAGKDSVKVLNTDDFPVERVSWQDTQAFLNILDEFPEIKKMGLKFRLPTEAEWEYTCRGGANEKDSKPFYLKNGPTSALSAGQINSGQKLGRTSAVGSFPESVNSFGLYDMHGNVWEWCEDYYDPGFYTRSPKRDPLCDKEHSENKNRRVLRGGSWNDFGFNCRAANRGRYDAGYSFNDYGFRVACVGTR